MKNFRSYLVLISVCFIFAGIYFLNQQPRSGTIVLLNGTSSAGKTSIIKELQKIYGDSCAVVIGDDFLATYLIEHPQPISMTQDAYQRQMLRDAFLHVKQLSLHNAHVFVDFAEINAKHYCTILDCNKVVKILVYCPLDILVDRVAERNRSGNTNETRTLSMPFGQFLNIYKLQESSDEVVVDRIKTSRIKYAVQIAEQDEKPFVEQFKLDTLKEIVLVPKQQWDLIVNTGTHSSREIAKIISVYLSK